MGRPPLKLKDPTVKTTLRLPQSLLLRAKAAAGEGDASELMREGIETEVRRRERQQGPNASPAPTRKPKPPFPDTP